MKQCTIEKCPGRRIARGWCFKHWRRWRRHGNPLKAPRTPRGFYIHRGRRIIYRHGIRQLEHRYVMEQKLGRKLHSTEIVHHRDHNPLNNHLDNLELTTRSIHMALHATTRNTLKKECSRCHVIKFRTEFYLVSLQWNRDRNYSWCKDCCRKRGRQKYRRKKL